MARRRDYKREYAARTARAKSRGYPSYGVERRVKRAEKDIRELQERLLEEFGEEELEQVYSEEELFRLERIDILNQYSGFTDDMRQELVDSVTDKDQFWKVFRPLYDQLSRA